MRSGARASTVGLAVLFAAAAGCRERIPQVDPSRVEDFVFIRGLEPLPKGETAQDCGPEALSAVFRFWGRDVTFQEIAREVQSRGVKGMLTHVVAGYVRTQGFDVRMWNGAVADLIAAVDRGRPVIIMVRQSEDMSHFFVVAGYSSTRKLFAFLDYPAAAGPRLRVMRFDRLADVWAGADNLVMEVYPAPPSLFLGFEMERLRDWDRAVAVYRHVLLEDPALYKAHIGIGNCLYALKRPEEAADAYRKALELSPGDPQAGNNLAHVLWEIGKDREEALRLAEGAVRTLREAISRVRAAVETEKQDDVRALLEEVLPERIRMLALSLGTYGDTLCAAGRHDDAAAAFAESRELFDRPEDRARRSGQIERCLEHEKDRKGKERTSAEGTSGG